MGGQASELLGYTSMALVKAMKAGELVEVNSGGQVYIEICPRYG